MSSCCGSANGGRKEPFLWALLITSGIVAALLLSSCRSTATASRADAALVRSNASARIGADIAAPNESCVEAELQALLSAELTEDAAVRIALINNRSVAAEYERLGIARAELVQAGLLSNPVFDGDVKFFENAEEIELKLSQPFLDLFFIPLRQKVARSELAARKAEVTRSLVRVAFDVRRAFVSVRSAQQVIEIRQQALKAAEASRDLMRRLYAAGNVPAGDLTLDEGGVADARLSLAAAELAAQEAREPMNVLLGVWGENTQWKIEGRLSDALAEGFDVEGIETRAITNSLDLAEARCQMQASAQLAGLTNWEGVFPTGDAGIAAKQETSGEWGVGPAAAVAIPIFDTGAARVAAARASIREQAARYASLAVEIRSAARLLRERSLSLRDRAVYVRQVLVPLRSRLVRETLQNFNAMQIGAFEVLRVKQQEAEAGREYVEGLRDAWLARLDLAELVAGSLNRSRLASMSHEERTGDARSRKEH
jgi:outer membrane protein, heavy metal efflux system